MFKTEAHLPIRCNRRVYGILPKEMRGKHADYYLKCKSPTVTIIEAETGGHLHLWHYPPNKMTIMSAAANNMKEASYLVLEALKIVDARNMLGGLQMYVKPKPLESPPSAVQLIALAMLTQRGLAQKTEKLVQYIVR